MKNKTVVYAVLFLAGNAQAAGWVTSGTTTYINDGGGIGINTTSPGSVFEVRQPAATGYADPRFFANSDTNWQGPFFILQRTRGTKSAPTAVQNGDYLGTFDFWGQTSAGGKRAGQIVVAVDGTAGSNYVPGKIMFNTTNAAGTTATRMLLTSEGRLGIGTTAIGTYRMAVEGSIRARELVVDSATWPDYVFADDYKLMPLSELSSFVERENHLPGMPKATDAAEDGIGVGEATRKLLEKVEELTLYLIELDKENKRLKVMVESNLPPKQN